MAKAKPKGGRKSPKKYTRVDNRQTVADVLRESIVPYAFSELDEGKKRKYAQAAKDILNSEVFQNESAIQVAIWTRYLATKAEDMDEVKDLRMCINALEIFKDRLVAICDYLPKPSRGFDPQESI